MREDDFGLKGAGCAGSKLLRKFQQVPKVPEVNGKIKGNERVLPDDAEACETEPGEPWNFGTCGTFWNL
jgi:hypothetical protein